MDEDARCRDGAARFRYGDSRPWKCDEQGGVEDLSGQCRETAESRHGSDSRRQEAGRDRESDAGGIQLAAQQSSTAVERAGFHDGVEITKKTARASLGSSAWE